MNFRKILVALILVSIFAGLAEAVTISSVFNLNAYYAPGEYMKPFVKAVDDDGTPAEPSEGYNGRYIILNSNGATVFSGSLNYDRGDGYWKNGINAPYEGGLYTIVAYVEGRAGSAKGSAEFKVGAQVTPETPQPVPVECKEELNTQGCSRKVCTDGYQGEWNCPNTSCKEETNAQGCTRKICQDGYQGPWICPGTACKEEWNEKKCYRKVCTDGYQGEWACPTINTTPPEPVPPSDQYPVSEDGDYYIKYLNEDKCSVKEHCWKKSDCKVSADSSGCVLWSCDDGSTAKFCGGNYGNADSCTKFSQYNTLNQKCDYKKCTNGFYEEVCRGTYPKVNCEDEVYCEDKRPDVPHEEFEQCLYYYQPGTTETHAARGTIQGSGTGPTTAMSYGPGGNDYYQPGLPGYPEECYTKQCCYRNERCKMYYDEQGRTRWDCPDGSYKIYKKGKGMVDRLECKKTELPGGVTTVKGGKCFKKTCNDGTEETICMGNENLIKCDDSTECKGKTRPPVKEPPVKDCECKTWRDNDCVYAQCPGQEVQKICCPRGKCPEKEPPTAERPYGKELPTVKRPYECDEKEYVYAKRKCYDNGGTPMYTEVNSCPQIECAFGEKKNCPSDEEYATYKEKMVQECQQSGMEYYGYQDEMGCAKIACIEGKERKCPPIERMDEKIANCKQEGKEIVYKDARGCQVPVCVPVEKARNRATEKECADIVAKIEKVEKTLVKLMDKIDKLMSYYAQKGNDAKVEELNNTRIYLESGINSIEQNLPNFKEKCSTEYSEEQLTKMREEIAKFIQVELAEIRELVEGGKGA